MPLSVWAHCTGGSTGLHRGVLHRADAELGAAAAAGGPAGAGRRRVRCAQQRVGGWQWRGVGLGRCALREAAALSIASLSPLSRFSLASLSSVSSLASLSPFSPLSLPSSHPLTLSDRHRLPCADTELAAAHAQHHHQPDSEHCTRPLCPRPASPLPAAGKLPATFEWSNRLHHCEQPDNDLGRPKVWIRDFSR